MASTPKPSFVAWKPVLADDEEGSTDTTDNNNHWTQQPPTSRERQDPYADIREHVQRRQTQADRETEAAVAELRRRKASRQHE